MSPSSSLCEEGECNQGEMADHLVTTTVTVRDYERRGWIKRLPNGKYDKKACRENVIRNLRSQSGGRSGDSDNNLASARAELAQAQREAIQWKQSIAKGDFVSAESVIRRLQDDFAVQRTLLLSWTGKLPSQVEGLTAAEIEAVLEREIYEVLEALANPETYIGRSRADAADEDQQEGDGDVQAAAKAKPRRVGGHRKEGRG